MSALKPILGAWLLPLPMALILVCVGLVSRRLGRRRLGGALIVAAGLLVFASSFGPVGELLLLPLESSYPPVLDAAALRPTPSYVVVLGSGYRPRAGLPVTAALDSTGVVRLTEGLRLLRQLPDARLVVSGGSVRGWPPIARGYALGAAALGVPPASLLMIDTPRDTAEEIRALRALTQLAHAGLERGAVRIDELFDVEADALERAGDVAGIVQRIAEPRRVLVVGHADDQRDPALVSVSHADP